MDSVGGLLDAFTSKEMVSFNAKVLDEHLPIAFDVLSDLVLGPLFADEDIAKEKQVILEEIRMEDDNPESLAHETAHPKFLARPSPGRAHPGHARNREGLHARLGRDCFAAWYAPEQHGDHRRGNVQLRKPPELVARVLWRD